MPVGDRRLPAGKMAAAVAAVGVAVDDGSIVDIVQRQVAGQPSLRARKRWEA